jgi:hypothetical protein
VIASDAVFQKRRELVVSENVGQITSCHVPVLTVYDTENVPPHASAHLPVERADG